MIHLKMIAEYQFSPPYIGMGGRLSVCSPQDAPRETPPQGAGVHTPRYMPRKNVPRGQRCQKSGYEPIFSESEPIFSESESIFSESESIFSESES
ncbi:MAG: hypothetical protein GY820_42425, partial [Gammaproteobacteria bacterium]|nr:hypothetical protein [Gammaproteobacteria bacterium]